MSVPTVMWRWSLYGDHVQSPTRDWSVSGNPTAVNRITFVLHTEEGQSGVKKIL